uniref:Ig-like domain-containing protein n=1 Tax=Oryzias melastigma TaxID=30732 RepID=A0A3B3DHK3_ORYME
QVRGLFFCIFELFSLHLFTAVTQSAETPLKIVLTRTELGDNVTLICSTSGTINQVNWFKYEFGYVMKTVYTRSYDKVQINDQFDPSRFIAEADGFSLSIRNVSKEEEGTYLCQAGSYLTLRFVNGNHLVVKDPKKAKVIHVQQSSGLESVFPGSTSELQCSVQLKTRKNPDQCLGEQRVYWYEAGSEPHADIIHATSLSCDDHARRCVYNPSKTIQNLSGSSALSCAVLSCGQILFGVGTKEQMGMKQKTFYNIIILGTLLACSVLVNIILFFIRGKGCCEHSKGKFITFTAKYLILRINTLHYLLLYQRFLLPRLLKL